MLLFELALLCEHPMHNIILLQNKPLNISEIANKIEFSSRSFFTRYVKKLLGVTPSEYRGRLA